MPLETMMPLEEANPPPCSSTGTHRRRRRRRKTAPTADNMHGRRGAAAIGMVLLHAAAAAAAASGGSDRPSSIVHAVPTTAGAAYEDRLSSSSLPASAAAGAGAAAETRPHTAGNDDTPSAAGTYPHEYMHPHTHEYLTEEHLRALRSFDPSDPPPRRNQNRDLQSTTTTSTPTAEDAKCRPLLITEWLTLLQTETNAEYDLTAEVAAMAGGIDPSILLARAQLMWEDATDFEWMRSLDAARGGGTTGSTSTSGSGGGTPAPFVVCLEQTATTPRLTGFRRRRILRDAIRSAIGTVTATTEAEGGDRWVHRDITLRTLYNGADMLCAYGLMDGVVAQELSFDGCAVQPLTMSMKLLPRTVELLLEKAGECRDEVEGRQGQRRQGAGGGLRGLVGGASTGGGSAGGSSSNNNSDANGKAIEIGGDQRQRRGQGTVLDLLLGDGDGDEKNGQEDDGNGNDNDEGGGSILDGLPDCDALDLDRPSADIILCPGSLSFNQLTALQAGDPSYIVASLTSKKGDQSASIPEQVYWTSSAAAPYRRMESSRAEYWRQALVEAGSERCDEVFRTRLRWSVRPGTDDGDTSDFAALRVVYDASTAETWESACVGTLIAGLAVRQDVCGLELSADLGTTNVNANWMVQGGVEGENPLTDVGLDGAGQVVALSDTGIDVENCYFFDADFEKPTEDLRTNGHRKIAQYRAYADGTDEELGHGTHVAAIIAGNRAPDGIFEEAGVANGIAPASKIAFLDISSTVGKLNPPSDNEVLSTGRVSTNSRSPIAHIHSMSWGSKNVFYYNNQARMFDNFMYANDDFLAVVAAGNEGQGDKATSVGAPGNSKNVLSVGASHAFGDDLEPGQLGPSYLASFSSRGPTTDGRIAPDVVAPGKYILSAAARPNNPGACDPLNGDIPQAGENMEGLYSQAGSSMSAPLVAGAAALVRQYFEEGWHGDGTKDSGSYLNPSGALVKATIINGAQADIRGVDNGSKRTTTVRPYDNNAGFGRMSLTDSLYVAGKTDVGFRFWDGERLFDGDIAKTYEVTIDKSRGCDANDLSVTLAWIEEGSPPGCTKCLLNDLDLYVTEDGRDSIRYHPNGRSIKDDSNNVERVVIDGAKDGSSFTIHVEAYNLNSLSQKYALVATGCFGGEANTLDTAQNVFREDTAIQQQSDGGGGSDNTTTQIIIIVCASVGGVIVLCLGLACFRRYQQKSQTKKKKAKQKKKHHDKTTVESAVPELQRGRAGQMG